MPQGPIGDVNFVTFDIDPTTGILNMNIPDRTVPQVDFFIGCYKYGPNEPGYSSYIDDGNLYCEILYD